MGEGEPVREGARRLRGLALSQVIAVGPVIAVFIWSGIDYWSNDREVAKACLEARGDDPSWIVGTDLIVGVAIGLVVVFFVVVWFFATVVFSPLVLLARTPRQSLRWGAMIGVAILACQGIGLYLLVDRLQEEQPMEAEEAAEIAGCADLPDD